MGLRRNIDIRHLSVILLAGVILSRIPPPGTHLFFFAGFSDFLLLILLFRALRKESAVFPLLLLFALCSGFTDRICDGIYIGKSGLRLFLEGMAAKTAELIDSMAFESSQTPALIKAVVCGDRSSLDPGVTTAFRSSGAAHILALSGFHLAIIYSIVSKITSVFGKSAAAVRVRIGVNLSFCVLYALGTGAAPSIVRACIFIIIRETARLLQRQIKTSELWCGALCIQLIINPSVISSVGFQLSYAAVAGLFAAAPKLRSFYPESEGFDPVKKLWDTMAVTISCQLFTAPLVWHYFGSFPQYFLLTNLICLPLSCLLMWSALLCIVLSALSLCPDFLLIVTGFFATLMTDVLKIIAEM